VNRNGSRTLFITEIQFTGVLIALGWLSVGLCYLLVAPKTRQTVAFTTLALSQMSYVMVIHDRDETILRKGCPLGSASSARDQLDPYPSLTNTYTVVTCSGDNPNRSSAAARDVLR
jgi:hypothetical protein